MRSRIGLVVLALAAVGAGEPATVSEILASHDRVLIRDLGAYLSKNPKATDAEQAYMALFEKVIEHDWFADHEPIAKQYLAERPDGPVGSLARIVATMARAQAGRYDEALAQFRDLMASVGRPEQEEFAANFADTFAASASAAGEYAISRQAYEILLARFRESPNLRQKVDAELAKLNKIGKQAPNVLTRDVNGGTLRLADFQGKYVLVDFWATWCAPCVAELPRLQAAYAKYHDAGFEIVGVSLDETKSALTDYVKARSIPWRQVHDASAGGGFVDAFGVTAIPATFLIDPQGVITRIELRGAALDQTLAKLIKPTPAIGRAAERPLR